MFEDGSFVIVDASGHMPGHQMALAKTKDKVWVSMGGDCHHRDLLEDIQGYQCRRCAHVYRVEAPDTRLAYSLWILESAINKPTSISRVNNGSQVPIACDSFPSSVNGWVSMPEVHQRYISTLQPQLSDKNSIIYIAVLKDNRPHAQQLLIL